VRLDAGKAARFNVSTQSTGGFDRLLPHTERDLPLPKTPKGEILATQRPGIRGMSDKAEHLGECRVNVNATIHPICS
jgi:hypothetical protein